MKGSLIVAFCLTGAVVGLILAYREMSEERISEGAAERPVMAASRTETDGSGQVIVTLGEAEQRRLGLEILELEPIWLPLEVKAYGRVMDPVSLMVWVADIAKAESERKTAVSAVDAAVKAGEAELASRRAVAAASTAERDRLKTLGSQDNASMRALESAEASARRDRFAIASWQAESAHAVAKAEAAVASARVQLQTRREQLMLATGKGVGEQGDLPGFVDLLARGEMALVRLDLPAGETLPALPREARIAGLADEKAPLTGSFLGPAARVGPQTQGQGFLFLVREGADRLRANAGVTGWLQLASERLKGVIVPRGAVVRSEDRTWIYLASEGGTFARRAIRLHHLVAGGWFVTAGVRAGDRVVVSGAQALLSEEFKSGIRMAD